MPTTTTRRPLPALAFLLALTVLTAIVWWRVLHRDSASSTPAATPTPTASCATPGKKVTFPKPASVTVRVLNGNGQVGLATSIEGQLKARGFRSAGHGDADALLASTGELRYGAPARGSASLLSYYLPGLRLVVIHRADATVDVVLGKAFHGLATPTAVQAAITRATKPC